MVPGMGERRHAGNSHVDRLELLKLRRDRTQRVVHLQHATFSPELSVPYHSIDKKAVLWIRIH